MRKRTYARPVLALLGDLYHLTKATPIEAVTEFFNQANSSPHPNV